MRRFAERRALGTLPEALRDEARDAARAIGERLLCEMRCDDVLDPNDERYANRCLNGPPGFALAFLALAGATGESRFEEAMHRQLRRAAAAGDRPKLGVLNGISGLRAVAELATAIEPRYGRLVAQCDAFVDEQLPARPRGGAAYGEYDLLFGWAGMRLARCVGGPQAGDELAQRLLWLVEDPKRWCCEHPLYPHDPPQNNLGMAHGIPGVLAALALTLPESTTGARDAIAACAHALAAEVRIRGDAYVWPRAAQDPPDEACRSVWCFGTPGVAIALLQTAQFLGDAGLERVATGALSSIAALPRSQWLMTQSGICHGSIGNALVFAIAAARTGRADFDRVSQELVRETLVALAAGGGRIITRGFDGLDYDAIGHLNGIAGVATAFLTLTGELTPAWLRLHGMQHDANVR